MKIMDVFELLRVCPADREVRFFDEYGQVIGRLRMESPTSPIRFEGDVEASTKVFHQFLLQLPTYKSP